eukprot:7852138-Pyramimonas_sp.AAC.1
MQPPLAENSPPLAAIVLKLAQPLHQTNAFHPLSLRDGPPDVCSARVGHKPVAQERRKAGHV